MSFHALAPQCFALLHISRKNKTLQGHNDVKTKRSQNDFILDSFLNATSENIRPHCETVSIRAVVCDFKNSHRHKCRVRINNAIIIVYNNYKKVLWQKLNTVMKDSFWLHWILHRYIFFNKFLNLNQCSGNSHFRIQP